MPYSIIIEAFIAKVDRDTDLGSIGPLADLPKNQRDEVLLIQTFDRDGGFDGTRFLVTVRRPIGPNFLGPRDDETLRGMQMTGRLGNLLK